MPWCHIHSILLYLESMRYQYRSSTDIRRRPLNLDYSSDCAATWVRWAYPSTTGMNMKMMASWRPKTIINSLWFMRPCWDTKEWRHDRTQFVCRRLNSGRNFVGILYITNLKVCVDRDFISDSCTFPIQKMRAIYGSLLVHHVEPTKSTGILRIIYVEHDCW